MRYRSTYIDGEGNTVTALLDAPDEQALHDRLHRQGHTLVKVRPQAGAAAPAASGQQRLSTQRLILFLQALQSSLEAGVPLLGALDALRQQETDGRIEAMYADIQQRVAGGESFSEALAAFPRTFPPVLCALVRLGESSGNLPEILTSLVSFMEWRASITATVRQAAIYPAVILTAGYGLIVFLLAFVVPQLSSVIEKMVKELPAASRMLFDLSKLVAGNVGLVVLGTIAAVAALVLGLRTERGRAACAAVIATVPVTRTIVRALGLVQLCRNLSVMLASGLTLPVAIEYATAAVPLASMRKALDNVRARLLSGGRLTEALEEHELLPPVALGMVRVGEETGRLAQTFDRLAGIYDREIKDAVKRALGLLEPIVTVLLGITVGGVAVLVITTIYSAMRGLGR